MELITYELKYCERCGSLGLRRCQSSENYCEPCGLILTNYVLRRAPERRPVFARNRKQTLLQLVLKGEAGPAAGRLP